MTTILKIITIIYRESDMNRTTAKTVNSPTFYKTKLKQVKCLASVANFSFPHLE